MANSRTVIPQGTAADVRPGRVGFVSGSRPSTARALARSLLLVALAAFGILVVLPTALAAQASLGF